MVHPGPRPGPDSELRQLKALLRVHVCQAISPCLLFGLYTLSAAVSPWLDGAKRPMAERSFWGYKSAGK